MENKSKKATVRVRKQRAAKEQPKEEAIEMDGCCGGGGCGSGCGGR